MTIGKSSRRSSARSSIRAPKFLDKASGFYGRLDEPEAAGEEEEMRGDEALGRWEDVMDGSREKPSVEHVSGAEGRDEAEAFEFGEGMMEDDGESLLQRKPSWRSSRWRRSSRRKQKEAEAGVPATLCFQEEDVVEIRVEVAKENKKTGDQEVVHFAAREEADDQVLIREKKRGRDEEEEEGEEERKMKREQEEGMKMVKRNAVKNYRKVSCVAPVSHIYINSMFTSPGQSLTLDVM